MDNSYPDLTKRVAAVLIVCGLAAAQGCADRAVESTARVVVNAELRAEILARTEDWFESGWLSKPSDAFEDAEAYPLAPLVIHLAARDASTESTRPLIGALSRDDRGVLVADPSRPTVYFDKKKARIAGRDRDLWSYVWWYAAATENSAVGGFQGIRMTLDESGFPLIWEVLVDSSGARLLFVSSDLEQAAADRFGPPSSGRDFSVERTIDESPDVVVTRLLESGPMPLGPFVYGSRESSDVMTLICRCSPSQVREIQGTEEYDLAPVTALDSLNVSSPWSSAAGPGSLIRIPGGAP